MRLYEHYFEEINQVQFLNNLVCGTGIAALSFAVGFGAVISPLGMGMIVAGVAWKVIQDR
ncbi:hypothetical protein [Calothrix sp. NIES-2100]|uniref:hypothetical protein n=1 Tax=Calothrix sp. NIES-2100 TaxID=1954172 RepID=UPI0030DC91F2